jgi:hypothetical protein
MTNENTTNTKKTYFFNETITIQSRGIVANSFEEAQEKYLNAFVENVKFGKMIADSSDFTCYSQDAEGNETHEY